MLVLIALLTSASWTLQPNLCATQEANASTTTVDGTFAKMIGNLNETYGSFTRKSDLALSLQVY